MKTLEIERLNGTEYLDMCAKVWGKNLDRSLEEFIEDISLMVSPKALNMLNNGVIKGLLGKPVGTTLKISLNERAEKWVNECSKLFSWTVNEVVNGTVVMMELLRANPDRMLELMMLSKLMGNSEDTETGYHH